jgi:UTP-glucose-1-phosphate uridylyltransferase
MHNKTLAIMAAGLGSRYGGLKQLDAISDMGYSIIDYSVYDAIQSGFNHIIFIIREETHDAFKIRFDSLNSNALKISYAFQDVTDLPKSFKNKKRMKPWGTAHALYTLRHIITANFSLINADDFYDRSAFKSMYNNLFYVNKNDTNFLIGYQLKKTLSAFGSVSRGACFYNQNQDLTKIIELTKIEKSNGVIKYNEKNKDFIIESNTLVSMNFWGFTPSLFTYVEESFIAFLEDHINSLTEEFLIPTVINTLLQSQKIAVKVIPTESTWFGMTYIEDKPHTISALKTLIASGVYPKKLR